MCHINTILNFLRSEDSLKIGCRLEVKEMLQLWMKTYELCLIFTQLFDGKGASCASDDLSLVETVDQVVGTLEH